MTLEEAIELAKLYYLDKEIPKNTREWRTNCPPELTAGKINSMPFTVGDVLRGVNPNARARTKKVTYDLNALGFNSLSWAGSKGTYTCSCCNNVRVSERSTILKWQKEGTKFCSSCRDASGAKKDLSHYTEKLPDGYRAVEVVSSQGNTKVIVEHIKCGNTRVYSSRQVLSAEYLCCSHCDGKGEYASMQEKIISEHIKERYYEFNPVFQVKYSSLASTSRRWVLDIFIKELNLALEVTTKGNGFDNYFLNLNDKMQFLKSNGYTAEVVYSTKEVDDIVRSLLKDREG